MPQAVFQVAVGDALAGVPYRDRTESRSAAAPSGRQSAKDRMQSLRDRRNNRGRGNNRGGPP